MNMPNDDRVSEGYLLLADISGYTAFLTGTELEHAHAIIRELTKLIRSRLAPPMKFVKLEGDAVFCYAGANAFNDGERFVELIEVCYFDFANRLQDMTRATTCKCDACRAIPTLGLKFVTHYGSFMIEEDDDGREDLAGPDVILVHRLLKNGVSDGAGPQAYAFFTDECMKRMPSWFSLPPHRETYDSFGEVTGGVHDLQPVLAARRDARRVYINADDADFDGRFETAFAPEIVWQYFVDPDKRLRWQSGQTAVTAEPNPGGRMGAGASTHCAHGEGNADGLREYLDWRPFSYFTNRYTSLRNGTEVFVDAMETMLFTPREDGGTAVNWRIRVEDRSESAMRKFDEEMAEMRKLFPLAWIPLNKVMEEDGFLPAEASSASDGVAYRGESG
jgi:uncharacterized protein YndB with AHSA1/START domain